MVECPPTGDAEVLVKDPDGLPLKDRTVAVLPASAPLVSGEHTVPRFTVRTDGEGRLRMRWFAGLYRLRVMVPGVGFGSTGLFEVLDGRVTKPEMAPLVRFGEVSGRLAPGLAGPGVDVSIALTGAWDQARVACDGDGRFVLRDIVPGFHALQVSRGNQYFQVESSGVTVAPGARIKGVELRLAKEMPPMPPDFARFVRGRAGRAGDEERDVDWVEGDVRDTQGRAVGGASVYVQTAYHGGMRMVEEVRATTADAGGHFRVRGPVRGSMQTLTVVVHAKGRPPAVASYPSPEETGRARPPLTVTLADKAGRAAVTAVKDGKPLSGAGVKISHLGAVSLYERHYVGSREPGREKLEALFHPTAVTGPDGIARFGELLPGLYHVIAVDSDNPQALHTTRWARDKEMAFGEDLGFSVTAGRESAGVAGCPSSGLRGPIPGPPPQRRTGKEPGHLLRLRTRRDQHLDLAGPQRRGVRHLRL